MTLTLTITYKNGTVLKDKANYVHIEDGKIYYTVASQVHGAFQKPAGIPMENVSKFDVELMEE